MTEQAVRVAALAAALLPPLILMTYFCVAARVRIDDERIWQAFGFGAAVAFPVLMLARLYEWLVGYGAGFYELAFAQAYLGASIPEEIGKLAALLCLFGRELRRLSPARLFVLAIAVSCGFAALENIFYVLLSGDWGSVAILRSVSAVPGHAFVGALMGYCIARAVAGPDGWIWWLPALALPILLHGAYNTPLFALNDAAANPSDAPPEMIGAFVWIFALVVVSEGALAHLCLRSVLRPRTVGVAPTRAAPEPQSILRRWARATESPLLWTGLAVACVAAAVALVSGIIPLGSADNPLDDRAQSLLMRGYAAFAILHAVAFAGLAITLNRRNAHGRAGIVA
ncbi:MAG: PrsW family glutamic-type intramembrane protease [Pseudomonadota bacterium]